MTAGLGGDMPALRPPGGIWGCGDLDQQQWQGPWQGQPVGTGGQAGAASPHITIPLRIPSGSDEEVLERDSDELASGKDASLKRLLPQNVRIYH